MARGILAAIALNVGGCDDVQLSEHQRVLLWSVVDLLGQRHMTVTEICMLAWAIVGVIVVARVGGRRDEPGRENRN
jgi:hypothetical protein